MPARGGVRGPVASMGCGWLDDYWKERPTVCTSVRHSVHSSSMSGLPHAKHAVEKPTSRNIGCAIRDGKSSIEITRQSLLELCQR
jgi:hypothetical protein